jgi:RHS repeat-associated protein
LIAGTSGRLRQQGGRIGPSIILKVMAGDKVQINTYAYYTGATQTPVSDNTLLTDLLSTLVSGVTNQSGGKIVGGNSTALSNAVSPNVLSFLNNRTYNSSLPKAYLNWVLLDDQFKYVAGNMGALQVQSATSAQALVAPLQTMAKNGYLYVYLSNQSPQDVYFDNLIITHTTGPLLQEQSYYPFGLQMAGISDKALNKLDSKNKFNGGVELEDDYGVNLYSTFYRQYDPQIGRFGGVDVLSEKTAGMSVYQFGGNNPAIYNDPTGALFDQVNAFGQFLYDADGMAQNFSAETDSWGGSGGGGSGTYSSFWNPILDAVSKGEDNIPGLTSTGTTQRFYNYSNLSGSGIFETPNNNGVYTESVGEKYHFIGVTDKTSYDISYSENNSNQKSNGWEIAGLITESGTVAFETTEQTIIGAQKLANAYGKTTSEILTAGKVGKVTGVSLGVISLALTVGDGLTNKNGWQNHHTADVLVTTGEIALGLFEATSPIGWAVGIGLFVGDLVSEHYTSHTITENLFDDN